MPKVTWSNMANLEIFSHSFSPVCEIISKLDDFKKKGEGKENKSHLGLIVSAKWNFRHIIIQTVPANLRGS